MEIKCWVALTKFFWATFSCILVCFISSADKFVTNGSKLDSHHRYINIEWIYTEWKELQSMVLTLGNGQIWLGTPPVVLHFIIAFFHIVVCNCLFKKTFVLILTLGKWQIAFDNMCLWKIIIFFWELTLPTLRFRFTVVVIKSRRLPGDQRSLWGAQMRRTTRAFAQWNLILAHVQHSKFDIVYRITLSKRFAGCISTELWNCMRTKINICSMQNFLTGNIAGDQIHKLV